MPSIDWNPLHFSPNSIFFTPLSFASVCTSLNVLHSWSLIIIVSDISGIPERFGMMALIVKSTSLIIIFLALLNFIPEATAIIFASLPGMDTQSALSSISTSIPPVIFVPFSS